MNEKFIDLENENESTLIEINEEEINKIDLNPFEKIYRNLGKEIREKKEENINLEDLLKIVKDLKQLYLKNEKKILLIGGVNVLLPLFEILYKQKNNTEKGEFNSILIELNEILVKIFSEEDTIYLSENFNFFHILKLLIEEYDEEKLKLFSNFISKIINMFVKNDELEIHKFPNFINLFLFDEKFLTILNDEEKEKILSLMKKDSKLDKKILLPLLINKDNFKQDEVYNILLEKIQKQNLSDLLNEFGYHYVTPSQYKDDDKKLIDNEYYILEKNYDMLFNKQIEINENNFDEKYNNIINQIEQNKLINEKNILKVIISNYFLICKGHKYKEKIRNINNLLIKIIPKKLNTIENEINVEKKIEFENQELININIEENQSIDEKSALNLNQNENRNVNKNEKFLYSDFELLYYLFLIANYKENGNKEKNEYLQQIIKNEKEKENNINYFENRKIYKQIKTKLFSWNGYYSDLNIFYNKNSKNKLKYKIYHFLTKENICPFIKPILDINSYLTEIQKFNPEKIFNNQDIYSINLNTFPFKKEKIPKNESFKSCLIKPTNHISGNIYFEDNYLLFIETDPLNNENENIKEYDFIEKDGENCYGNLIKFRSGKGYFKKINYEQIYLVLPRVYYFKKNGCEIYTNLNKSFYFKFKNEEITEKFYDKIREIINQKEKDLNKLFSYYQINWKQNRISNLEYLMWLNIFSNRSYRDITQYPVCPWILSDYNLEYENLSKSNKRDFKLPLGMMEIGEKGKKRKESYIEIYKNMYYDLKLNPPEKKSTYNIFSKNEKYNFNDINFDEIPYLFGSHFSNPAYISHYLVRLFPFSLTGIEIQGDNFDAPDRLFINIEKSFISVTSQKSDLRELIPEFFSLPEMFINLNNLNLGKLQKNKKENSTFNIMKKIHNISNDEVYVDEVLLPCNNDPYKFVFEYRKILEKENEINYWIDLFFGKYALHENAEIKDNLYMGYCYYDIMKYKFDNNKIKENDIHSVYKLFEIGFNPIPILKDENGSKNGYYSYINEKLNIFNYKGYCNEVKNCIKGQNENKDNTFDSEGKKIKLMKIYNQEVENLIEIKKGFFEICGLKNGSLFIFKRKNNDIELYKVFHDHSKEIIDIAVNDILKIFVDISNDGFINIYTFPECDLINSIYIKVKENEIFEKIYLSSSPLPSIIIKTNNKLISYSINGKFLKEIENKETNIKLVTEEFIDYFELSNKKRLDIPYFNYF